MPDKNQDSTFAQVATDVAVIKNEIGHITEDMKALKAAITNLSVVTISEFDEYKKQAAEDYVRRSELSGLLKFWNIATGFLGKTIAAGLVAAALYFASKAVSNISQ